MSASDLFVPEVSILSIDAWGNAEDGFEWNNWFLVGTCPVTVCDLPEKEILTYMVREGYLHERAIKEASIDDDQYNVVICDTDGRPLYAIAYGENQ